MLSFPKRDSIIVSLNSWFSGCDMIARQSLIFSSTACVDCLEALDTLLFAIAAGGGANWKSGWVELDTDTPALDAAP